MRRSLLVAAGALSVALLAGCGGSGGTTVAGGRLTILLDSRPNAVHSGLYLARRRGYDEANGVRIRIRKPGPGADALKQINSGRADAAILGIHDLGRARARGADLVAIMALVQRPLAAVIARPGIESPRDLEGERVGVSGRPGDDAVLESVVRGGGGDPERVRRTRIGSDAVQALIAGRVAAATAFWSAEGVSLERRRPGFRQFRVDDFGAPAYPELVLVTSRSNLEERRGDLEAAVHAMQRGYEEVIADPESAVQIMLDAERGLDQARLAAELTAVAPTFEAGSTDVGKLDLGRLRAWVRWDVEFGVLEKPIDVEAAFDRTLAGGSGRG